MDAKIENGELVIRIACDVENPPSSASGKTLVISSTRGNMATDLMVKGKPVTIGLNAYIKR